MLRKIRIALAALFFVCITLLLVGIGQNWWAWTAKLQFLPACLALNFVVVAAILLITLLFGRIYCSTICPLGVFQDLVIWLRRSLAKIQNKFFARRCLKAKEAGKPAPKLKCNLKKSFEFKKEHKVLRFAILAVFILALVLGLQFVVALIAPYSAYGRIVRTLVEPRGWAVPVTAILTLVCVVYLAWTEGRAWCNSICPVGSVLSLLSRFSIFRISIDESKCTECGKCYRACKASCIDGAAKKIDCSKCVDCFDCIENCSGKAITFSSRFAKKAAPVDEGKRAFMLGALMLGTSVALDAKTDGGLAPIVDKKAPKRSKRLTPPGSIGEKHFYDHCTACQLCVASCPNNVLHPSNDLGHLMQPKMDFDRGFCRPECTSCSKVCPAGAILPLTPEEKTAVHIGRAVVDYELCVVNTDGVSCGNCSAHCPAGAISMVHKVPGDSSSPLIPSVIEERCIGCGKCEYLCPARPLSAIHVEGLVKHITE